MIDPALVKSILENARFRWLPGARWINLRPGGHALSHKYGRVGDDGAAPEGSEPDFDDPATVGTIEAQVRAISPFLYVVPPLDQAGYWIVQDIERDVAFGKTLGEAWGRAFLEVA